MRDRLPVCAAALTCALSLSLSLVLLAATPAQAATLGGLTVAEPAALARILTPLIKFRACRDARKVTGDAMEVRGGCGYIEEWADPLAQLVRDPTAGERRLAQAVYASSNGAPLWVTGDPPHQATARALEAISQLNLAADKGLKPITVMTFNNFAEAFQALRAGQSDAATSIDATAMFMQNRGDFTRAQFYIRRLNNSEMANAESLWLGIRVERRMDNRQAMEQLASQLRRRFPQSRELLAYERGAFDE